MQITFFEDLEYDRELTTCLSYTLNIHIRKISGFNCKSTDLDVNRQAKQRAFQKQILMTS